MNSSLCPVVGLFLRMAVIFNPIPTIAKLPPPKLSFANKKYSHVPQRRLIPAGVS